MQYFKAFHPLVTGNNVGSGVAFGVSDMKSASRGIGKHVEDIEFIGIGKIVVCFKGLVLFPVSLPLLLYFGEIVFHCAIFI